MVSDGGDDGGVWQVVVLVSGERWVVVVRV